MFLLDPTIEASVEVIGSNTNQVFHYGSTTGEAYVRFFGNELNSNVAFSVGCSNADDNSPVFVIGENSMSPYGIANDFVIRNHQITVGTQIAQPGYAFTVEGSAYLSGGLYASNLTPSAYIDTTNADNITSGTLDAARLAVSGVVAGIYGSSNAVPQVTVDNKGRITSIVEIATCNLTGFADVVYTGDYNSLSNTTFYLTSLSNAVYMSGNVGIGTVIPLSQLHITRQARVNSLVSSYLQPEADIETFIAASADVKVRGIVGTGGLSVASNVQISTTDDGNGRYTDIQYNAADVRFHVQETGETYILGNIGVGTTVPDYPLQVVGEVFATSFTGHGSNLTRLNASSISSGSLTNERLPPAIVVAANTQSLTIATNGNVGIGTATPESKLHVDGDIYASGKLTAKDLVIFGDTTILNTTSSNTEQMVITNDGTGPALKVIQSGMNTVAEFYDSDIPNGIPNLIIANGGNVGLGTTTPTRTLHVQGDIFASGSISGSIDAANINSGTLNNARLPSAISVSTFSGDGASLSNLNATYITTGTLNNSRLPSAISVATFSGDGASLSNLNATVITTGTLDNARLPSAISVATFSGDGASLSNLNATVITTGTLDNARLPSAISVSTLSGDGASLSNLNATSITTGTLNNSRLPSAISVATFSGDGASLSNLNATVITTGTLNNARLPSAISVATFSGDGASLSNLNATYLTTGTLDNARLPPALTVQTLSPVITVASDGNVGIGSSTPIGTLQVAGQLNTGTGFLQSISANRGVNVVGTDAIVSIIRYGGQDPSMELKRYNVAGTSLQSYWDLYTTNEDDLRIRRRTAGTTTEDAWVIDTNKNIGIGTVTPTQKLHVQGGSILTSDTVFTSNISGNAYSLSNLNATVITTGTLDNARLPSAISVSTFSGDGASLSNLNATAITTGTLDNARLPSAISVSTFSGDGASLSNLNATVITTGTLNNARLPSAISVSTFSGDGASLSNLNATVIITGTLDNARLPSAISVSTFSGDGASLSNLNATVITTGTLDNARLPSAISVSTFSGDGASLSNLNATYVTTGTLDNARLPYAISVSTFTGDTAYLSNIFVSENIGIGTDNPQEKLHVNGNIITSGTLFASNVNVLGQFITLDTITSNTQQMFVQNDGTGPALKVIQSGANSVAEFYDKDVATPALYIADGGNVGLGTDSPLTELQVVGTISATSLSGDGASLSNLNASYIFSGFLSNERMSPAFNIQTLSQTFTIDTATNVGIGTATPLQRLHVEGSALVTETIFMSNISGNAYSLSNLNASYISTGFLSNERMSPAFNIQTLTQTFTIDTATNVGIGTTTPLTKLHVEGTARVNNTGAEPALKVIQTGAYPIAEFYDADISTTIPCVLIANNGNVGIGTTTPSYALHVENNVYFTRVLTTEVTMTSDRNLKTNVKTIDHAIDIVNQLRGVHFEWREESARKSIGLIAQEVEEVLPELVHDDARGYKSISYGNMIGVLIEAIKEQQAQIRTLQERMEQMQLVAAKNL